MRHHIGPGAPANIHSCRIIKILSQTFLPVWCVAKMWNEIFRSAPELGNHCPNICTCRKDPSVANV